MASVVSVLCISNVSLPFRTQPLPPPLPPSPYIGSSPLAGLAVVRRSEKPDLLVEFSVKIVFLID
jgi:hypothetical protein